MPLGTPIIPQMFAGSIRQKHSRWKIVFALLVLVWAVESSYAQEKGSSADRLAQRVGTTYKRVSSSLVSVQGNNQYGRALWSKTGVIVTHDGLVLCTIGTTVDSIEIILPDGHRAKAKIAGWSAEWNIALLRVEGTKPLPHIKFGDAAAIKPGQTVVTFGFREPRADTDKFPSLRLETIVELEPRVWFSTTGEITAWGWRGETVFDLEGNLLDIGDKVWGDAGHRFYTDTHVIKSLWGSLSAGKNSTTVEWSSAC